MSKTAKKPGAKKPSAQPVEAAASPPTSIVPEVDPAVEAARLAEEAAAAEARRIEEEHEASRLEAARQYGAAIDSVNRVKFPLLTLVIKTLDVVPADVLLAPTYASFVAPSPERRFHSFLAASPSAYLGAGGQRESKMSMSGRDAIEVVSRDGTEGDMFTPRPESAQPPIRFMALQCAFAATKRKPPKPKKKPVEPEPEPEPEPPKPRMTLEEAQKKIEEHSKAVVVFRKTRQERDKKRLETEMKRAEQFAEQVRQKEEEQRRQREETLRQNLERLKQKREMRELEHEISEQRVKKLLHAQNANDAILAKQLQLEQQEEARRREVLQAKRERMDHVVSDLTKVRELLKNADERSKMRQAELREHLQEIEKQRHVHYQGANYEKALEEYTKCRHGPEDDKHQRLYRVAKMQEYGKLVAQLAKVNLDNSTASDEAQNTAKAHHHHHQQQEPAHPSATILNPLSPSDRAKVGNNYLREGFTDKSPLPPGLKLVPLLKPEAQEIEEAKKKNKARTQLGLDYLKEARKIGQQYNNSPHRDAKPLDKSEVMKAVHDIRVRTNLVERRIMYGRENLTNNSAARSQSALGPDEVEAAFPTSIGRVRLLPPKKAVSPSTSPRAGEEDPSYVEVINAKIEMLKKIEMLRRKSLGPAHLVKW